MTDEEFERFAVRRWPELARVAWLLTGDARLAAELADDVLARAGADWDALAEDGAPTAGVRRVLLEEIGSRAVRRRLAASTEAATPPSPVVDLGVLGDAPPDPDAHDADRRVRRDVVRTTLLGLDPDARAALALSHGLDLRTDEVAGLTHASTDEVIERLVRGADALARALSGAPDPDRPAATEDPDAVAARGVADLADALAPPTTDLLGRIAAAGSRRRRRRLRVALSAVAATVVLVGGVALAGVLTTGPEATDEAGTAATGPAAAVWAPRGELSSDPAAAAEVRRRHPNTSVLYAGVVGRSDVLVLHNRVSRLLEVYRGRVGTPLAQLDDTVQSSWEPTPNNALVVQVDAGQALVLAGPELAAVELSPTATITADGTVTRAWQPVTLDGGTAVVDLGRLAAPRLLAARAPGADARGPDPVRVVSFDATSGDSRPCPACDPSDSASEADQQFLATVRADVASLFGLDRDRVRTTLRWSGPVDDAVVRGGGEPGASGRLQVALTTLPDGAVVRSAQVSWVKGDGTYVWQVEAAAPVPARDAADAPFVLRGGEDAEGAVFQVVAPGASSVTLIDDDTSPLSPSQPLTGGTTVIAPDRPVRPDRLLASTATGGRVWPVSVLGEDDPLVRGRD